MLSCDGCAPGQRARAERFADMSAPVALGRGRAGSDGGAYGSSDGAGPSSALTSSSGRGSQVSVRHKCRVPSDFVSFPVHSVKCTGHPAAQQHPLRCCHAASR